LTGAAAADMFGSEVMRLKPGQVSVPTQLMELDYSNDRNLKNLEKPVFIHKGQTTTTNANKNKSLNQNEAASPLQGVKLGNKVVKESLTDTKKVKARLSQLKAADRQKRLKACNLRPFNIN
jgi:hypothetical protein